MATPHDILDELVAQPSRPVACHSLVLVVLTELEPRGPGELLNREKPTYLRRLLQRPVRRCGLASPRNVSGRGAGYRLG